MNTFKSFSIKMLVGGAILSAFIAIVVSIIVALSIEEIPPVIASFFGTFIACQGTVCLFWIPVALWVFPLIDCITNEPSSGNDKIVWILLMLFTNSLGGILYLLIRRPQRIQQFGH
jgi:hypothetical protein